MATPKLTEFANITNGRRSPLHILKRPHGVGCECPALDAFGVNLARLGLGVAMDCHDLVLRAAVLCKEMPSGFPNAVTG